MMAEPYSRPLLDNLLQVDCLCHAMPCHAMPELRLTRPSARTLSSLQLAHRVRKPPQVVAVSATSSPHLEDVVQSSFRTPRVIDFTGGNFTTPSTLSHYCILAESPNQRNRSVTRFMSIMKPKSVIAFANRYTAMVGEAGSSSPPPPSGSACLNPVTNLTCIAQRFAWRSHSGESAVLMVDFLKRKNVRVSELLAHTERGDRRKALDHLSRGLVRVHALQRMSVAPYHYYELTLFVLCSTLQVHVLASTDMASRGLDLSRLTHVFNYEVPPSARHYLHRAGRAGREGRTGTVVTVVCNAEEVECVPWCKTTHAPRFGSKTAVI